MILRGIAADLQVALAVAQANNAQVVLLEGAAGLGKSHAMRDLASAVKSGLVLSCSSDGWLVAALRASFAALQSERDPAFLEAARRLVPELPWARVAQAVVLPDQLTLWNALALAFERLAKRVGGLVWLLEDAHEVSAADLAGIRALYRRALLGAAPMLFVISARLTETDFLDGFIQDSVLLEDAVLPQRLVLAPLEQTGLDALLESALHGAVPENLGAWLMARAEGHPLYTLELLRFLQDGGALQNLGLTWVFDPPKGKGLAKNLEAVLQARIATAKRETRLWSVLTAICVLNRQASLSEISKIIGIAASDLLELATRLEYLGLLREELNLGQTVYAVAHPLFPPLVRAQLERVKLQELHHKITDVVTSVIEKAHHAKAAQHPQAMQWSALAFEQASAVYNYQQVVTEAQFLLLENQNPKVFLTYLMALRELGQLETILEVTKDDHSAEVALHRVYALDYVGQREAAFESAKQGFLQHPEPIRSRIGFHLVRMYINKGQFLQAEEILHSLDPADETDKTLLFIEWQRFYYYQSDLKKQLEMLEQAEISARKCSTPRHLMIILSKKGIALTQSADHVQAEALMQEALQLTKEFGSVERLAEMHNDLGLAYLMQGNYPKASQMFRAALRYAQATKNPMQIAAAYSFASSPEFAMLRLDSGRDFIQKSIELFQEANYPIQVGNTRFFEAYLESIHGNTEFVHAFFNSELAKAPEKLYSWHSQAGEMYLNIGEFSKALEFYSQVQVSMYPPDGLAEHHHRLAVAYLGLGQLPTALKQSQLAQEHGASMGNRCLKAEMRLGQAIIYWFLEQPELAKKIGKEALAVLKTNQARGHAVVFERLFPNAMQSFGEPLVDTPNTPVRSYLRTFGVFGLEQDGLATPWRASKVRDLLAVLLVAYLSEGGPSISKAQLIDEIWQDESPESSEGKFRVSIKRLRDALGDAATIHNHYGVYELQNLKADVVFFLAALENLDFDAALGWYKGSFLQGIDVADAEIIRAQLWQNFRDTVIKTSFETPNANLLEKLHYLEPLDIGILERYLEVIADDAYRTSQTVTRAKQTFEREIGEIPVELGKLTAVAASSA